MKTVLTAAFMIAAGICFGQGSNPPVEEEPVYDMQTYYLLVYMSGPERDQPKDLLDSLQTAHLAHLDRLAADNKICMAGPLLDDSDWRGIVVFNTSTIEEANELAQQDPMVQVGRLTFILKPWMAARGSTLP